MADLKNARTRCLINIARTGNGVARCKITLGKDSGIFAKRLVVTAHLSIVQTNGRTVFAIPTNLKSATYGIIQFEKR